MNLAELVPLTAALINFALVLFVASAGLRSVTSRVFVLWGTSLSIWNLGTYFMFRVHTAAEALLWAKILQIGVIFLPISFIHVSHLLTGVSKPRLIPFGYLVAVMLAASDWLGFFVSDVRDAGYAWYSVGGPAFWVFFIYYSVMTSSTILMLWRRSQTPSPLHRSRAVMLLWASGLLVGFGVNDILPILGVYRYPLIKSPIFPFGSLAAIVYGSMVGYSALQHRLLDVHVAFGRVAAHVVRFAFLFLIGLVLQFAIVMATPKSFTLVSLVTSLLVLLISAVLASILFPRLFGGTGANTENWERRILGDRFEYQDQIRSFIERMTWYPDLPTLLRDLHALLTRSFRLESYKMILRDEVNNAFTVAIAHPEEPVLALSDLTANSPVFRYFERRKGEYLSLNRDYIGMTTSALELQARAQLEPTGAAFCFPLAWQDEPFGLLLIGQKNTEHPFTATDINLLVDLAKNMSLVANQMRLKTQILQTQELDMLGRMSRGMAHDLNNLLTPVSTLLQLASETGVCDDELLPTALRNVTTMQAYIKESLFFSEHPRPDLRLGRLDVVVRETAELARSTRKKPIEITAEAPSDVLVEMNEVLIQRLLTNLISNAIDASMPEMLIQVKLERLPGTETTREWLRLRVIDQGEGISRENLDRVQTPYFTTKNRGDETRGFGLGLAICRKIVTLHGGRLSIESQLGKGTTVQVDLPSRQLVAEPQSTLTLSTSA